MGTRTTDCRKFSPNIFNKSKCSHCFRQREEHSAAALECNRASRKVSKCGYLFVAPDWDFSNPLYRTKRWQRRWFVLYDDGELTYSVDEHPETVPQASIDMTKVLEVTTAEDVTGHSHSIAITAPDRVTFVKGTCPEEAKWWLNILAAFPKSKGRHKRNATFPGGQATTMHHHQSPGTTAPNSRNRHHSYHKDMSSVSPGGEHPSSWMDSGPQSQATVVVHHHQDQDENNKNAGNELNNRVYSDQPVSSKSPPTRDKIHPDSKAQVRIRNRNRNAPPSSQQEDSESGGSTCLLIEDVHRDEKLKDIANTLTTLGQITNQQRWTTPSITANSVSSSNHSSLEDQPTRDEIDYPAIHLHHQVVEEYHKVVNMRPRSLPLASNSTPAIVSAIVKKIPTVKATTPAINIQSNGSKSSLRQKQLERLQASQAQERGDPDGGCNLDDIPSSYLSKNAELRVNLPSEELLNTKKGWLMKQDIRTGEWSKHWFTLRGAALFYYRDPVSEERGVLDGVLDVNSLTSVNELGVARNFGFQMNTWDNRRIILATISANSRNNWINVLRTAAGLQPQADPKTVDDLEPELIIKDNTSDDLKREIEKDFIKAQRNQEIMSNNLQIHESGPDSSPTPPKSIPTPLTPATPKTILFSSDEEYRTASEGGRRESVDWGSPLSPSPPIPTSIFRAKDRMRSRSSSANRLHKRSRSSPPSSRRSTVDSVGSDELPLIHPVQEELNIDKELQLRLVVAEKELDVLKEEARERESRMSKLLITLERTELELTARIHEVEEARDNLSCQLSEANCKAEAIVERLTIDLEESHKKIRDLEDRLSRGIDENDSLYKKLRELEGASPSSFSNLNRSKMKRVDSLSDLTNLTEIDPYCLDRDMLADEYNELRSRFEKAVNEIKAMKKELKESQKEFDTLEISYAALKQDLERQESEDKSQLQMMANRIEDLTQKYANSERQVRTLKQKLAKSERRRSLSLKGKDGIAIPKELEDKVNELETKVETLDPTSPEKVILNPPCRSTSDDKILKRTASHLRRRSLESSASADSLQFLVRLNALEKRVENASSNSSIPENSVVKSHNQSSPKISEHLLDRLKCLESVLITSKDRIEQGLTQLQTLKSSRTRRSVSPIADRKDSFRFVERCLQEVVKLMRDSCESCVVGSTTECSPSSSTVRSVVLLPESNPIKLAVIQLESQLREKLGDLLKQRRVLRERNELNSRKDLELLAERIAFESVCFGKLRDSISRAEDPTKFGENQTRSEIAETSQLMVMLKAKLSGKCGFKPAGSVDVLAGVLARRLVLSSCRSNQIKVPEMPPVSVKVLDDLLRQQDEINLITKRYKNNAMENLACGLAAETLSYISSNDAVQGAVQEAWRQAQEAVNAELVQSEIGHIMLRNAQRFENSITPSFGYTLTAEERLSFETFADAVHDALRKEMDNAVDELKRCYENTLLKMKRGQWRLHLEHERRASEGRQLLAEFADIIAHKALVDARISVLKGQYVSRNVLSEEPSTSLSVASLQKYENLFEELSHDLQISNPDDILAEADFKYLYKHFLTEHSMDKPQLKEVSIALCKLEQIILLLQSTLNPNISITTTCSSDVENLKDICSRCCDLRDRLDGMIGCAQKISQPCEHCNQMQTNMCHLTAQHETEMENLRQVHDEDLSVLRKQLADHLNAISVLESERSALLDELNLQTNLVEDHERELANVTKKLKDREEECHRKDSENLDLIDHLEEEQEKERCFSAEKERLVNKCLRQDEEYVALLQERDYIQGELNKERERARKLEKRLELLEVEHSKQLECLQEAYKDQILSHCNELSGNGDEDESFRQRYHTEIEQLRTLCEKGLAAMESSHRRIVNDLEEKHQQEIERLLSEKEQALAEETQATLAALDAMRKAHQSEVQREVARFKQEFLRQIQKGGHSAIPTKEKEEELEELRQEILSFSEKYSIKCVENAALEEKLRSANQKLKHFQQMQQLELRNKQFRAHLASEDLSDLNFVQGLASSTRDEIPSSPDSEHVVDVCRFSDSNRSSLTIGRVANESPITLKNNKMRNDNQGMINNTWSGKDVKKSAPSASVSPNVFSSRSNESHQSISPKSPIVDRHNNNENTVPESQQPSSKLHVQNRIENKPVDEPKKIKPFSLKNLKANLVVESTNRNQRDAETPSTPIDQSILRPKSMATPILEKRSAVNLSSLSEFLSVSNSQNSENINKLLHFESNNNNSNNIEFIGNRRYSLGSCNDLQRYNRCQLEVSSIPSTTSAVGTASTTAAALLSNRKCSPPPLNGRDVEHHHTTSHLRRFELEI